MENKSTFQQLLPYLSPFKWWLGLTMFIGIIGGSCSVYMTYLTGKSIDTMIGKGAVLFNDLYRLLCYFAAALISAVLSQWLIQRIANYVSYKVVAEIRKNTFKKLNHLPISYFDQQSVGDITSRFTNDLDFVADALIAIFVNIFSGMTIVVISLLTMLKLNLVLTAVILLATPFMFLTTWVIAQTSQKKFSAQQNLVGDISNFVTEMVGNQKLVKAFQQEEASQEFFNEKNMALYEVGQQAQFVSSLTNPLSRFIDHLSYIAIGLVGGWLIIQGKSGLTVGILSSFIIYSTQFTKPFIELSGITPQIQSALAGLARIFSIVNQKEETDDSTADLVPKTIKGNVQFKHVSFSYQPDQPLIKEFNLSVNAGETIAIVGQTGAGKSTLVNLLMRFYDIQSGEILLDGVDITTYQRDSLRKSFGMVLQDTWLFDGTIKDNLTFGNPEATEAVIEEAVKTAKIDHFIQQLPDKYNTVIGSKGINISDGQRQLLTIARTMIANSPMLILDEATSSVDSLTESAIQEGFLHLMKGKTSFVIAHRLATIQEADKIIVMKDGQIVQTGTHKELLAQKHGYYSQLYQAQFSQS